MRIYIRNQEGNAVIEKGKILSIGGTKGEYVVTGEDEIELIALGKYENTERAKEILDEIIQRIVEPTAKEVQKGVIFIDLYEIK